MKSHLEPPNPTFQSREDEYNFNNLRYIHKNEYYPQGLEELLVTDKLSKYR